MEARDLELATELARDAVENGENDAAPIALDACILLAHGEALTPAFASAVGGLAQGMFDEAEACLEDHGHDALVLRAAADLLDASHAFAAIARELGYTGTIGY